MRRITLAFIVGVSLACGLPLPQAAFAKDIFVSNVAGDDLQDGTAPRSIGGVGGPTQTIAKALRIAGPGDRIILENAGRPYRESLSMQAGQHSGVPDQPFVLHGNGAILDGSAPVRAWEHFQGDVYRFAPERLAHQQLYLAGLPAVRRPISSNHWKLPDLLPREWLLYGGHIYFRTEEGKLPESYEPSYAVHPVGITMYKVRGAVISDLIVQGFQLDGITVHDGVGPCTIERVNCRGNGRSGICTQGGSRLEIVDSVVGDNGEAQLFLDGLARTTVRNCELIANTAPAYRLLGGKLYLDDKTILPGDDPDADADADAAPAAAEARAKLRGRPTAAK